MNPMLQRHCAKFIYIVPDGLRELMSDISREVIRSHPQDTYTFIADYLDALMITRENARIAARLVESITEIAQTTVELLQQVGMTREQADRVVRLIQKNFREYYDPQRRKATVDEEVEEEVGDVLISSQMILHQLEIDYDKLEGVATIIQNAYHKFKERQRREHELLFGIVDWRIAAKSAIALYRKTGVTHYEANRAASLIKAAYKGYYTRRTMKRLLSKAVEDTSATASEENEAEIEEESSETVEEDDTVPTEAIYETGETTDQVTLDGYLMPFTEEDLTMIGEESQTEEEYTGESAEFVPEEYTGEAGEFVADEEIDDKLMTREESTVKTSIRTETTKVIENVSAEEETLVSVTTEE